MCTWSTVGRPSRWRAGALEFLAAAFADRTPPSCVPTRPPATVSLLHDSETEGLGSWQWLLVTLFIVLVTLHMDTMLCHIYFFRLCVCVPVCAVVRAPESEVPVATVAEALSDSVPLVARRVARGDLGTQLPLCRSTPHLYHVVAIPDVTEKCKK